MKIKNLISCGKKKKPKLQKKNLMSKIKKINLNYF